jgi:hypothetical protein
VYLTNAPVTAQRTVTWLTAIISPRLLYVANTRWFKYDRDKLGLVDTHSVPIIFEPPCIWNQKHLPWSLWLCSDDWCTWPLSQQKEIDFIHTQVTCLLVKYEQVMGTHKQTPNWKVKNVGDYFSLCQLYRQSVVNWEIGECLYKCTVCQDEARMYKWQIQWNL